MPKSDLDREFMIRAIELSRFGFPAPNPRVGCVIVRDGEIVGEGFHDYAGGPHAEANALTQAGDRAKDASVYVTLEPCNHQGRTPPCTQALIESQVKRVVFAGPDPNPNATGGAEALRQAGIEVESGLMEAEAKEVNRRWLAAMEMNRPFVAVKAAISMDGRMAMANGESKWITGESARAQGRRLRAELGAVLVGRGTIDTDDPELTDREPGIVNQPTRIILDPFGAANPNAKWLREGAERIWFVGREPTPDLQVQLPIDAISRFAIPDILEQLWNRGITGVLVEGGAKTIACFIESSLVDEIHLFIAPKIMGSGSPWSGNWNTGSLVDAKEFDLASLERLDRDLWLQFRRRS